MKRTFTATTLALAGMAICASQAFAAFGNPKHFEDPTHIPTGFGPNNYVVTYGTGPGSVYGIEDMGTADRTGHASLWNVGDAYTTKQEFTDLYARRDNSLTTNVDAVDGFVHDGSASISGKAPKLTAHAPGYITSSGNFYSFGGNYGAHVDVANYDLGLSDPAVGTLLIMQASAGVNPDYDPLYAIGELGANHGEIIPGALTITDLDGNALPQAAEILNFGILYQALSVPSSFGDVSWQELMWAVWLPEYTGDVKIDFGIAVHSAFSSLRVDTAIGTLGDDLSLSSFQVYDPNQTQEPGPGSAVPEPATVSLLGLGALALLRRRTR